MDSFRYRRSARHWAGLHADLRALDVAQARTARRTPNWVGLLVTIILLAGFALAIVGAGM